MLDQPGDVAFVFDDEDVVLDHAVEHSSGPRFRPVSKVLIPRYDSGKN